jgi:periplasmic divalent cation tolerance protein
MSDLPQARPVQTPGPDGVLVAISNAPDEQTAQAIARALVEEGLAACVNILPAGQSVYRWQGAVEQAHELSLIIKTSKRRFNALAQRLTQLHPYELPEFLAITPDAVLPAYADWVLRETRPRRV